MRRFAHGLILVLSVSQVPALVWSAEADAKLGSKSSPAKRSLLRRWVDMPYENERSHSSVKNAFREVVAPASKSTVRVLSDGLQTSLGVIVHSDGYVLTKASELEGKLECLLADGRRIPASAYARRDDLDLALLRLDRGVKNLPVVQWSDSETPMVGSWLATPNITGDPVAIGVISVEPREIPPPDPILGVMLDRATGGVLVSDVIAGSGAARAGIQPNDLIERINGRSADSPQSLTDLVHRLQPGDKVTLTVHRNKEKISLIATLGDRNRLGDQEQAELMDSLGGPLSRRRGGFSSVLQHDTVLRPRDCGGAIVDLNGKAVGINIARASRVASYALPVRVVRPAVNDMLRQAIARASSETEHQVSAAAN